MTPDKDGSETRIDQGAVAAYLGINPNEAKGNSLNIEWVSHDRVMVTWTGMKFVSAEKLIEALGEGTKAVRKKLKE